MVALVTSILVSALMSVGIFWYARRRPVGTPLTWGEAMVGAAYVFFLSFLAYGVVPHQWLTLGGERAELAGRPHRLRARARCFNRSARVAGSRSTITYRTISVTRSPCDHLCRLPRQHRSALWAIWQGRSDQDGRRRRVERSLSLRPTRWCVRADSMIIQSIRGRAAWLAPSMPTLRCRSSATDYVLHGSRRGLPVEGGQAQAVHPHRPVGVHHL